MLDETYAPFNMSVHIEQNVVVDKNDKMPNLQKKRRRREK